MLPDYIESLVTRMLPIVAKGDNRSTQYFYQKQSGLSSQEWQALERRLLELGLSKVCAPGAIELTAEGHDIASNNSYLQFVAERNKQAKDSSRTNRYTRTGVIANVIYTILTAISIVLSSILVWFGYAAYKNPDINGEAIKRLKAEQMADSAKLSALQNRINTLANSQDSLVKAITNLKPPSYATPIKHLRNASPSPNRHISISRFTQRK